MREKKRKMRTLLPISLRELCGTIKHNIIGFIGIPEEKKKRKGAKNLFEEIIVVNFLNLMKAMEI